VDLRVGALQEVAMTSEPLPFGMLGLKNEAGIFLSPSAESARIELHFVDAGLGYEFRRAMS